MTINPLHYNPRSNQQDFTLHRSQFLHRSQSPDPAHGSVLRFGGLWIFPIVITILSMSIVDGYTPVLVVIFAIIMFSWFSNKYERLYTVADIQTVPSKTKKKGESAIYRHPAAPHGTDLITHHKDYQNVYNLYEVFLLGLKKGGARPCLGTRPGDGEYEFQSYDEVHDRIQNFGSGLMECGLKPKQEHFVGIYSKNCPEWVISELACAAYSYVAVPLYDTLGYDAIKFIINQTGLSVVVVEPGKLELLLSVAKDCPTLKHVIKIGALTQEEKQSATNKGVTLLYYRGVEALGKDHKAKPVPAGFDDLLTICYTSGTTGDPKGVMLTHKNVMSDAAGVLSTFPESFRLDQEEVHLSFLPLAHIFEQLIMTAIIGVGGKIAFYRGDIQKLMDDIAVARPTVFPAVPRLLNRVYSKILATVKEASALRQWIFKLAISQKKKLLNQGIVTRDSFWDRLVFKKIQARLGGRVKMIMTGAAPISAEVLEFFRIAFGCEVLEGYGQTETSAASTVSLMGDYSTEYNGHVGCVVPCSELKLVDVPEMEYLSTDEPHPRGEICIRGHNVFKGYYKLPDKTKEALDEEGWCHTGDIGMILPNGTLKIIDRKKNLFKLSQGEYIAPEKIENVYIKAPMIAQVFVYGHSLQNHLVAIVVPEPEDLLKWAKQNGKVASVEQLCADKEVNEVIKEGMIKLGKQAKLHSFEQVKDIHLSPVGFTVENNLLTPSFKLKRQQLEKQYKKEIDAMYELRK